MSPPSEPSSDKPASRSDDRSSDERDRRARATITATLEVIQLALETMTPRARIKAAAEINRRLTNTIAREITRHLNVLDPWSP